MGGSLGKKKSKIIIVGLDNSGKSTMINKLKPKKVNTALVHISPNANLQYQEVELAATVGFKVETFSQSKIDFTVFDMSGQSKYRTLWEQYYDESEVRGVITRIQRDR